MYTKILLVILLVLCYKLNVIKSNDLNETSEGSSGSSSGTTGTGSSTTTTTQNSNEEEEEEEGPSFIGLFSGLLETLTETKEVKDCPGQCVHTVRALICEATLENSACPGNMKCCVEHSSNETESSQQPPPPHYRQPSPPPQYWNNNKPNWHYNYHPGYNGPSYPPPQGPPPPRGPYGNTGPPLQSSQSQGHQQIWHNQVSPSNNNWMGPRPNSIPVQTTMVFDNTTRGSSTPEMNKQTIVNSDNLGKNEEISKEDEDDEDDELEQIMITKPQLTHHQESSTTTTESNIKSGQLCPGVCVAQRMIVYCDGIYNSNICSNDLKCCITHEYYMNNYKTNINLLLIKTNETTELSTIQDDELEEASVPVFHNNNKISTSIPSNSPQPLQPPPPQSPPPLAVVTTVSSKSKLNYCPGTCVNSLLTFFCDNINNNYHCENDNSCCMNGTDNESSSHSPSSSSSSLVLDKPQGGGGQNKFEQSQNTNLHNIQEDNCPRVCLPNNLYTKCPKVLRFNCIEGYFCCVSPPYNAYPIHPGTGQPMYPPPLHSPGQSSNMYPGPQSSSSSSNSNGQQYPMNPNSGKPLRPGYSNSNTNTKSPPPTQFNRNNVTMIEKNTISTTSKMEDEIYDVEVESDESEILNEKLLINCPGSCINTILSFTCFRNAEITDLFLCNKINTKCCAPKTAIKEYLDSINVTTTPVSPTMIQTDKVIKNQISNKSPGPINHYNPSQSTVPSLIQNNPHNNIYSPQQGPPSSSILNLQQQHQQTNSLISQQHHTISNLQQLQPLSPSSSQQQNTIPISNYQPHMNNPPINISPLQQQQGQKPIVILPQIKPQMNIYNKIPNFNKYICGIKGNAISNIDNINNNGHSNSGSSGSGGGGGGGNIRVKRVVGGEDSEPGEWCWQIALINNLNQYLCGGALIGTQWVLTAAHCVTNIIRSGDTIYVRVGDYDLTSKYGSPGAQTLRVQTTYIHHNHNSQTLDNDIALLKLQGQISLKEGVCLVCLPARSGSNNELYNSNKRCTVTGYGYMGESGPIPLRIREANLPIVPESDCIRKINAVTEKVFVLPTSSFCAGGELRNDACQGDGGGPLVCMDNGFYELTGLVSWGFGCGRENVPGVYVKVSSFIGWINQIISVNN